MSDARAKQTASADFVIEEVTDLDAAWWTLRDLFLGLHDYHSDWTSRVLRSDWEDRWKAFIMPRPDRLILVAKQGGQAVAYMTGLVRRDFGLFDEAPAIIDDAFVKTENRGGGVGTAMLRLFEDWSRRRGATELRLNVNAANHLGIEFWTRSGFSPASHLMSKPLEVPA